MHRIALTDQNTAVDPAPSGRAIASSVNVLLVTPDGDLREAGARVLAREGYAVRVAAHSGHAVLASLTSRVDVLITELSTPDISGPELAQLLRRHHPGLRVVFLASAETPGGRDPVVVRPFTRDDLLSRIAATSSAS